MSLLVAVGTLILNMKTRPLEYEDKRCSILTTVQLETLIFT